MKIELYQTWHDENSYPEDSTGLLPFDCRKNPEFHKRESAHLIRLYDNDIKYHHLTFETRGRKKLMSKQGANLCDGIALHELFLDKTGAAAYLLTPIGAKKHAVCTRARHPNGYGDALWYA